MDDETKKSDSTKKTWVDELDQPIDPRLREYLEKFCGPGKYGEQDENGVDLSLIRGNLRRTPTERLRLGDRATSDQIWIRQHARRL